MLRIIVTAMLAFTVSGEKGADEELKALCERLAKLESYSFTLETESEGGGFGGPGGGRRGGQGGGMAPAGPVTGTFKKPLPVRLALGDVVVYRADEQIVRKNEEGEWELVEPGRGGPGGFRGRGERGRGGDRDEEGRRGGRGRGEGGRERGSGRRGSGGGDDFRGRMALFALQGAIVPHTAITDIGGKVTDVVREEKEGQVTYSASLTPEAALEWSGSAAMARRMARMGGEEPKASGTIRFHVGPGGMIARIEIDTAMKIAFGEREMDRGRKLTVLLEDLGTTDLTVPDAVLSKLEL